LPLARDTATKIAVRDKTPSQARHFLCAPAEFTDTLDEDDPDDARRGLRVFMILPFPEAKTRLEKTDP
jgi:hypothetical protein